MRGIYRSIRYLEYGQSDPNDYMYDVIMPKFDGVCVGVGIEKWVAMGEPEQRLAGFIRAGYTTATSERPNVAAFDSWLEKQPWYGDVLAYLQREQPGVYIIGEWMNRTVTVPYRIRESKMWQVHDIIVKEDGEVKYPTLERLNAFRKHMEAIGVPLLPRAYFGESIDDMAALHHLHEWSIENARDREGIHPTEGPHKHEGFVRRRYGTEEEVDNGEQLSLQVIEKWTRPDFVPGLELQKNGAIRYNETLL